MLKLNSLTFIFLFAASFSFAQTLTVTATLSPATCSGTLVSFDLEYIPTASVATTFDFNSGDLPPGWDSTPYIVGTPCDPESPPSEQDGSSYFWASIYRAGLPGVRFVETNALNVLNGGTISFLIKYGADDPYAWQANDNCEDPDEPKKLKI